MEADNLTKNFFLSNFIFNPFSQDKDESVYFHELKACTDNIVVEIKHWIFSNEVITYTGHHDKLTF